MPSESQLEHKTKVLVEISEERIVFFDFTILERVFQARGPNLVDFRNISTIQSGEHFLKLVGFGFSFVISSLLGVSIRRKLRSLNCLAVDIL